MFRFRSVNNAERIFLQVLKSRRLCRFGCFLVLCSTGIDTFWHLFRKDHEGIFHFQSGASENLITSLTCWTSGLWRLKQLKRLNLHKISGVCVTCALSTSKAKNACCCFVFLTTHARPQKGQNMNVCLETHSTSNDRNSVHYAYVWMILNHSK